MAQRLIFGREPALVLSVISAGLSLLVTLPTGLTVTMAGVIVTFISAAFAAITAWTTRPIAPAIYTGLITAGADVLAAFHYEVSTATLGAVNTAAVALLMFITRGQVTPHTAK